MIKFGALSGANIRRELSPVFFLICAALLSACVSSKIETVQPKLVSTTPSGTTSELALSEDERKIHERRQDAIAQIHAKADAAPENIEAPNYNIERQGETPLLTSEQIAQKTQELSAQSSHARALIPKSQISAKHRAIAQMRAKGTNHYRDAMRKIKNSE